MEAKTWSRLKTALSLRSHAATLFLETLSARAAGEFLVANASGAATLPPGARRTPCRFGSAPKIHVLTRLFLHLFCNVRLAAPGAASRFGAAGAGVGTRAPA